MLNLIILILGMAALTVIAFVCLVAIIAWAIVSLVRPVRLG